MKRIFILLSLLFASVTLYANTLHTNLTLSSIQANKVGEMGSDELYLSLSVYMPTQQPVFFRIPESPMHWLSKSIQNVKNVELYTVDLKENEMMTIGISLIESDNFILNPDDMIGVVQVQLKNQKGKLMTLWTLPNNKITEPVFNQTMKQSYTLEGSGSSYTLQFDLSPPTMEADTKSAAAPGGNR